MIRLLAMVVTFVAMTATAAMADECASAQALVDKAINHYKTAGQAKAYADFMNAADTNWVNGELYVIVATTDGTFKVHPINAKLIDNPELLNLKDVNGVMVIQEMVKVGRESPSGGWAKYTWTHPVSKKLAPKQTWVKAHDSKLFMVGCYP